ncbi:uncharacterized protein [Ptychodera flava]|uniref:uncharacterized protein n=1 Tax=Ptychodera flava TaxID=63121 RepID=UPI003969E53D
MKLKTSFKCLALKRVLAKCNRLAVGHVFRYSTQVIILGCEDGVIRVYDFPTAGSRDELKLKCTLETKGGPIQSLLLHDITKFGSIDLLVGHSGGVITIFCNEQIVNRCSFSEQSVDELQVDHDATGNLSVVVGDNGGNINAFLPYQPLWRLRLSDIPLLQSVSKQPVVTCLLAANLSSSSGNVSNYVLACDDCQRLHVLQQGSVVQTLYTHTVVTAMCSGQFLPETEAETGGPINGVTSQIALAGQDGSIYIMSHFQIYSVEYGSVHLPLTQVMTLPTSDDGEMDYLLCAGHFNSVMLYHTGKLITKYTTSDWVNSMATADVDNDGEKEVIISCLDDTIHFLKVT